MQLIGCILSVAFAFLHAEPLPILEAKTLLLNVVLGAKFYFWVRQFEVAVVNESLTRPAGAHLTTE